MKMKRRKYSKKKYKQSIFLVVIMASIAVYFSFFYNQSLEVWQQQERKNIVFIDGGLEYFFSDVSEGTVKEFIEKRNILLGEGENIFPREESKLFSGARISLVRTRTLKVHIDNNDHIVHTQVLTVGEVLDESALSIDADDILSLNRETAVENDMTVTVTRVTLEEVSLEKSLPFEKKITEDKTLSWRKNIVKQKGENGIQKSTYRISKYNGKEVKRILLKTEVLREPIPEIITQGTLVELGKSHTGGASWYAYTGTMSAANPWLPKGSYVKVTNVDNSKSVIVQINDRGPFAPGRIIDLDKVAFAKIASLGAGVINVKMEEITN